MNLIHSLALISSLGAEPSGDLLLKVGEQAPPFAMRDLGGKVFSLRNHTGTGATEPRKAILLAFFATWCKPCMAEIPVVKRIHQRWSSAGRDVAVVYVGLSQGPKELGPFVGEHKLPWPVVPDGFGLLSRRYGASQLPHLFIIDKDSKIAFQHRGIAPDLYATLDAQLARVTGQKAPAETDGPLDVDTPRFEAKLTLGRPPSAPGSVARWQPLAVFLGESTATNVEVVTESSYDTFERALLAGKYDLTNASPVLASKAKARYEPLARIERQGTPNYFGILFTRRDSPIGALGELRGKTLGLVSESSTSGGLYPQLALLDAGLVPGTDVKIRWLGDHTKVAEAVQSGAVDAGGCYEDCRDAVWPDAHAKNGATRILTYTSEIPGELILVRRDLAASVKKKLLDATLALNDNPGVLNQISQGETTVTAIVRAGEADLTAIDAVLARVAAKAVK